MTGVLGGLGSKGTLKVAPVSFMGVPWINRDSHSRVCFLMIWYNHVYIVFYINLNYWNGSKTRKNPKTTSPLSCWIGTIFTCGRLTCTALMSHEEKSHAMSGKQQLHLACHGPAPDFSPLIPACPHRNLITQTTLWWQELLLCVQNEDCHHVERTALRTPQL